jgi:hypothetical protein
MLAQQSGDIINIFLHSRFGWQCDDWCGASKFAVLGLNGS